MNQRAAVPGSALSSIVDVYVIPRVLPAAKGAVARDSAVVRVAESGRQQTLSAQFTFDYVADASVANVSHLLLFR
jgi:hypothetical protein